MVAIYSAGNIYIMMRLKRHLKRLGIGVILTCFAAVMVVLFLKPCMSTPAKVGGVLIAGCDKNDDVRIAKADAVTAFLQGNKTRLSWIFSKLPVGLN